MPDLFYLDDSDRYSRLRLIGWWDQDRLRAADIVVVGAGAIGNEVLKNLALLGVGHVTVIDCDLVEHSNLSRSVLFRRHDEGRSKAMAAAAAMRDLNPDVHVTPLQGNVLTDLGLGTFRDADVVIACLDNREARLWVNRCCWKVGTPWIDGGIQEISGVAKVFIPPGGACYECAMTENDYRLINLRYSCPLLARDELQAGKVPTAPTIASLIGALQVQEALKLLHGLPVFSGGAMVFNGEANNFYKSAFQRREGCLSHETYPEPDELPLSSARATAADLFAAIRQRRGGAEDWALRLDRDLVVALQCACGHSWPIMRAQQSVPLRAARCLRCGGEAQPQMVDSVRMTDRLAEERLSSLGIPPYDIVRVTCSTAEHVVLLSGDRPDRAAGRD